MNTGKSKIDCDARGGYFCGTFWSDRWETCRNIKVAILDPFLSFSCPCAAIAPAHEDSMPLWLSMKPVCRFHLQTASD